MAGSIHHGAGEPLKTPSDGDLFLSDDGASRLGQGGTWCPLEAGPGAGYRVAEDFAQASGGSLPAPWATQDTSAAGTPTLDFVDDAAGGRFQLHLATTNEAEAISIYHGDQLTFDITKGPIFKARLKLELDVTGGGGAMAAGDILVFGLASARNATLDNITTNAWFRMEGSSGRFLYEADDGTTDTDDQDTGVDGVDNAFVTVEIDCSDLSAVGFYIDGLRVGQASIPAATGNVQPFIELSKAAAANFDHRLTIDYIDVYQPSR